MNSLSSITFERACINDVVPLATAASLIEAGAVVSVAGRAEALAQLPPGTWIGGTTPYVMSAAGGAKLDREHVFLTDFSGLGEARVASYGSDALDRISGDAPADGFALAIIPFKSRCHERFARDAADYPMAFLRPTFGWIAGYDLTEPGSCALSFAGDGMASRDDEVAVLHISLPAGKVPHVELVNLFEPDAHDAIRFPQTSFSPSRAWIGEREVDFAAYVRSRGLEHGALPLVGDFAGARLNASLQSVESDRVELYAPVFPGVTYHFAKPVGDYGAAFAQRLRDMPTDGQLFSCNCILNYVLGNLEGRAIGGFGGPITFGEIAYQLLNQTLVEVRAV